MSGWHQWHSSVVAALLCQRHSVDKGCCLLWFAVVCQQNREWRSCCLTSGTCRILRHIWQRCVCVRRTGALCVYSSTTHSEQKFPLGSALQFSNYSRDSSPSPCCEEWTQSNRGPLFLSLSFLSSLHVAHSLSASLWIKSGLTQIVLEW